METIVFEGNFDAKALIRLLKEVTIAKPIFKALFLAGICYFFRLYWPFAVGLFLADSWAGVRRFLLLFGLRGDITGRIELDPSRRITCTPEHLQVTTEDGRKVTAPWQDVTIGRTRTWFLFRLKGSELPFGVPASNFLKISMIDLQLKINGWTPKPKLFEPPFARNA